MRARPRKLPPLDLLAVVLLGDLATISLFAAPHVVALRATLGLPFVILGPGYALMSALYAREPPEPATRLLEPATRLLLTLALSIVTMVLVGLALNAARIALTGRAFVLTLLVVATAACIVASVRRRGVGDAISISPAVVLRSPWLWSTTILLAVFAGLLVMVARPLPDPTYAGYTQLSGLRDGANVHIAVKSAEHLRRTYHMDALAASGRVVKRTFTLTPGQQWAQVIHIGTPLEQTVRIRLYLAAAPATVYREVILRA
jgi:hypothetical protein